MKNDLVQDAIGAIDAYVFTQSCYEGMPKPDPYEQKTVRMSRAQ